MTTHSVPPAWAGEIEAWATKLRAGGRRPATIGLRTAHIRMLGAWAAPAGPWDLGTGDLEAWTGSKAWAPETRRSVRSSLRSFYTWGTTVHRLGVNPATDLDPIRAAEPMPRPCDQEVWLAALDAAAPREVRMMRLAVELGLRRGEIAQVHTRDVIPILGGHGLLVHGKGGKQRMVPLPKKSTLGPDLLREQKTNPGYLFPGQVDGHLSAAWVGRVVSRLLEGPWTMHTLRHYYATAAHRKTRNLLGVQRILGHASPATTQRYIATPFDELQELVEIVGREMRESA